MEGTPAAHLAVFSDYRALAWVLSNSTMGFGKRNTGSTAALEPGATLLLHTTTRCFRGSPGPSANGIIGKATVTSAVESLDEPVEVGDHTLYRACGIRLDALVQPRDAVPLGQLADSLHAFQGMTGWRFKLMSAPVGLDAHDAAILDKRLATVAQEPSTVLATYTDPASTASA